MKISKLINELRTVEKAYGDIEVQIRSYSAASRMFVGNDNIFVVPEDYEEDGKDVTLCNLQSFSH